MVKDNITGLPLASLDDFPPALKAAILRTHNDTPSSSRSDQPAGQVEAAVPVVFFAEVVRKLYLHGAKRYQSELAIVLTKDSLCFFNLDGFIERRVKVADIAAIVLDPSSDESLLFQASESSDGRVRDAPPLDPSTLIQDTISVGGMGIVVPGSLDVGFEFVFDPKQRARRAALKAQRSGGSTPRTPRTGGVGTGTPRTAGTNPVQGWTVENLRSFAASTELSMQLLVRALLVLSRRLSPTATEIQVVSHHEDPAANESFSSVVCPAAAAALHSVLRLPPADGSSETPVMPPTIETLSKEAQEARMVADGKLEVEEMVDDLLAEFGKHKIESWKERNDTVLEKVQTIVSERCRVEALRLQAEVLASELNNTTSFNDRRAKRLEHDENEARDALLNRTTGLSAQHDTHVARVKNLKADILTVEENIKDLHMFQHQQAERFIKTSYEADLIFEEAKDRLKEQQMALMGCQELPSLGNLSQEAAALGDATDRVTGQYQELMDVAAEQEESKKSQKMLKQDNKALEEEVLVHKSTLRQAKERTAQLTTKVSSMFAKRNRVAKDAEWREETQIPTLRTEIDALNLELSEELALHRDLTARCNLLAAEATVCADHEREMLIHNSITKSMAELAVATEKVTIVEEEALEDQMAELTASVPATARTHRSGFYDSPRSVGVHQQSSPNQQHVAGGGSVQTPRSALSSARRPAGAGGGSGLLDSMDSARSQRSAEGRNISFQQEQQPMTAALLGGALNQQRQRPRGIGGGVPYSGVAGAHQFHADPVCVPPLEHVPFNNREVLGDDYSGDGLGGAAGGGDCAPPGGLRRGYADHHHHRGGPSTTHQQATRSGTGSVHGEKEAEWIERALSGSPLSAQWSGVV